MPLEAVRGDSSTHSIAHICRRHRILPCIPEKNFLCCTRPDDITPRRQGVRLLEHHRLYLRIGGQDLHQRPCELLPLRACAHPHEQAVHRRDIAARWSRRKRDAVPLERAVLLYAPWIGLVRTILGKGKRAKRDTPHIKVMRRDLIPRVCSLKLLDEAHRLLHARIGEIRSLSILPKKTDAVRHGRLLPCVVVIAKLIGHTVAVRILRKLA